eukprot:2203945-Pyramimonas_sp.AAC.1
MSSKVIGTCCFGLQRREGTTASSFATPSTPGGLAAGAPFFFECPTPRPRDQGTDWSAGRRSRLRIP